MTKSVMEMFDQLEKPIEDDTKITDLTLLAILILGNHHSHWKDFPTLCLKKENKMYLTIYNQIVQKLRTYKK